MNKYAPIYIYLATYLLVGLYACPVYAQGNKFIQPAVKAATTKAFAPQLERQMVGLVYAPNRAAPQFMIQNPRPQLPTQSVSSTIPLLRDKGISISDGRGKETGRHSIVPSAVTVLGSPAIARGEERTIMKLRKQAQIANTAEYIPPMERKRWKEEFEALRVLWIKSTPSDVNDLSRYLTHQVPPDTLAYLQREYANLVQLIEQAHKTLIPKVIYSYMLNEGKQFAQEEKVYITQTIYVIRTQLSALLKAINKDPYLLVQQKYWDRMFGAFNPLLKGILAKPTSIFRQDNRQFVLTEFALHNPDGSDPYLPLSDSLIAGESRLEDDDDDFDEEQYSGQPEALRRQMARRAAERQHNAEMIRLAEQERAALLQNLPVNQRIAVINDDLLPLLNFQNWAKNGYLGKGATVSTFRDGFNFLQKIRNGARYDIVITDLVVPDGGVAMMENFRILDSNAVVFASSKFYPGDGDDHSAQELFNFGMDGYIWNNTNLNEGSFGYLQYLRQLNNYYYYKNKYGWQR